MNKFTFILLLGSDNGIT